MLKPTPKSRVLFVRKFSFALLVLFGVFVFSFINLRSPQLASAAAANTVNFQARLQTKAGGIVPDGNYNVEFKLYSASSGGSAIWTEDYLNSASHGLQTINGYLSANLGSLSSFSSSINWDQQLWLTMNIGGTTTGTVTWDGEMNPRIALTAVPYAFSAGQLQTTNGSNTSKLSIQSPTGGSQTFQLQDQGAAGTYNLLTQDSSGNVKVGAASSLTGKIVFGNAGSANTLTLMTVAESTGNATITIPDTAGVNDTVCLQTKANCGSNLAIGNLNGGTANAKGATISSGNIYLQSASGSFAGLIDTTTQTFAGNKTFTGSSVFYPSSPSLTGFQVQNSGGTIFDVDTTNGRVGINTTTPNYAFEVNGDINSTTNVRVGGVAVCVQTGCSPSTGSNNYIQNGTNTQTSANISIRSAATNAVTAVFQGASGQTSDILQVASWNGTSNTMLASVNSAGVLTVGSSNQFQVDASGNFTSNGGLGTIKATNAAAFSVQNASNVSYFNVDTSGGTITLGNQASGNYATFNATNGYQAFGSAQHTKSITLTAEYAGAVLDVTGDSTCTSATSGIMSAGYDNVNFQNYYKWGSNASAQCYDVVVRVPIPTDWASWSSTTPLSITGYTNNTSTSTLNLQVINGSNSAETSCNYVNVTPGSTSTWSTNSSSCTFASTTSGYSAGGVMTLRIRMTGNASSDVRLANITLNYNSKY